MHPIVTTLQVFGELTDSPQKQPMPQYEFLSAMVEEQRFAKRIVLSISKTFCEKKAATRRLQIGVEEQMQKSFSDLASCIHQEDKFTVR